MARRAEEMTVAVAQELVFRIKGIPGAQGSKVLTRWGSMRESSAKVAPWRQAVMWTTENEYQSPPIIDPVCVDITFFFARPKHHYGTGKNADKLKPSAPEHCTSCANGDLDKLVRGLLDPLTVRCGGNVLRDDSQVVRLRCSKQYASAEESPGALVLLRTI